MVTIKNKMLDVLNLSKDDFEPREESSVIHFKYIEKESLIYVEELLNNEIYCTFFNIESLDPIPKEDRYKKYNGLKKTSKLNGCEVISKISIDKKTGLERIHESVSKNNEILYKTSSLKYQKKELKPLWDRYLKSIETRKKREEGHNKSMKQFYDASYKEKLKIIKTDFNRGRRTRWEMGFEPIEQVFLKNQLIDYDKDPDFRKVLREILIGEEAIMGKSEEDIFNAILEPLNS